MKRHLGLAAALVTMLPLLGCHDPITEIVVVVDTDLTVPGEVDGLVLEIDAPAGIQRQNVALTSAAQFPATLGLLPGDAAGFGPFDVVASLIHNGAGQTVLVARRKATGVRFVRGATRALILSLPRACACDGTSCPPAITPACADLTDPVLAPFDPQHFPRVTPTDGGTTSDGAVDTSGFYVGVDAGPDAPVEPPREAGIDGAPTDAGRDHVPEASATLPRGHACGAGDVCQDGFCVDGVCCESACTCGACSATSGRCVAAAAGTDPRGVCGAYACNGAGVCETTCAETSFGACSAHCGAGAHCDGVGKCVLSTSAAGSFCIAGSCMCKAGLSCPAPDGGGAGTCQ